VKKFRDLKISRKLFVSFGLILVLATVTGIFSLWQLSLVNQSANELATNWLPSIKTLGDVKLLLARLRSNESQLILYAADPELTKTLQARTEDVLKDLNVALDTYRSQISEPEEKAIYPEAIRRLEQLLKQHGALMNALAQQDVVAAKAIFAGASSDLYFSLLKDFSTLAEVNRRGGDQSAADTARIYRESLMWGAASLLISTFIGVALAVIIARIISSPLSLAARIADTVAAGNLSTDIGAAGSDETGQVIGALRKMNQSLCHIISGVKTCSETIATASQQIATGNLDLSSRTEEQASSLQQTAAAMEQITGSMLETTAHSRRANELALGASSVAGEAGQTMREVVTTMSSISSASGRIVEIISVIDSIAFQTNILALNAAVEAARAGDGGRGFAIVAAEVRSLAQRSATAAKEIKTLIDNTVDQVGAGSQLVQKAGQTMQAVVASVEQVTTIVADIAAVSDHQSKEISEINFAIAQMDSVTQQNAALVEEAEAASQALQEQAMQLSSMVSRFRLPASSAALARAGEAKPASNAHQA